MSTETLRPYPTALLNPLADPIFKILFTTNSPQSKEALRCFLSDIFDKEVTDVTLQPNELAGECLTDKQTEFDINCKLDGKCVNIELQGQNHNSEYGKRVEYHVAHLLNHYTPKGSQWYEIPQVFQISVVNFIFNKKNEECVNRYSLKNQSGDEIAQILNVIFIELPKIAKLPDDVEKLTKPQLWGKFFLNASKENKQDFVKQLCKKNRGIKMATETLSLASEEHLNWYHESRYWMHVSDELTMKRAAALEGHAEGKKIGLEEGRAEGRVEGLAEGRAEGLAEGKIEEAKEIAKKMKTTGNFSKEQILALTGISEDEFEKLD